MQKWGSNLARIIGEGTYKLVKSGFRIMSNLYLHDPQSIYLSSLKLFSFFSHRDRENGGGTVLDMGTYTVQFATMCFKGLKPVKVIAGGHMNASGADDSSSATVIFPNGKTATLITHSRVNLPSEAIVVGTKGTLKVAIPLRPLLFRS